MKLTIGMAHHEDYDGVYFTCQALGLYQDLTDCEILIVDNSPASAAGKEIKKLVDGWIAKGPGRARYIPLPDAVGTSVPRDRVFREAQGEIVLCMDCHVMLWPRAIETLIEWFDERPGCKDLVTGPILYDDLKTYATHFDNRWRGEMFGTWGQAWGCKCGRSTFAAIDGPPSDGGQPGDTSAGICRYRELAWPQNEIGGCDKCGTGYPYLAWPGHEKEMIRLGFRQLGKVATDQPFEIPGNGLGLFACRKDAWPGFNPNARGFGGEELYIHEKIRRAGGRNWCLPFLRWSHRFGRIGGPKYPLSRYAKARNYVLEFQELGWDLEPIRQNIRIPADEWEHLLADPVKNVKSKHETVSATQLIQQSYGRQQPPPNATLDEIYQWCVGVPRDLDEHLDKLRELASKCEHVTEFGKRRESTVGLIAGRPRVVISYNTEPDELIRTLHDAVQVDANKRRGVQAVDTYTTHLGADSLAIDPISETDLLFVDTIHHGDRIYEELNKHGGRVRKWIVLRGTSAFWLQAEGGGRGMMSGVHQWMGEHPEWHKTYRATNQYGLLVLSRDKSEPTIEDGPGTELHGILESLGINLGEKCSCRRRMLDMDNWGIDGCKANRETIVGWLREGQDDWGWSAKIKAAALAFTTGLAFVLDWSDPFPSLIDEAIRRAEARKTRVAA